MARNKFIEANEKIAETVVKGYKKVEKGAVEGFKKTNDKVIEKVVAKEGESVKDAKKRLSRKADNNQTTVEEAENKD